MATCLNIKFCTPAIPLLQLFYPLLCCCLGDGRGMVCGLASAVLFLSGFWNTFDQVPLYHHIHSKMCLSNVSSVFSYLTYLRSHPPCCSCLGFGTHLTRFHCTTTSTAKCVYQMCRQYSPFSSYLTYLRSHPSVRSSLSFTEVMSHYKFTIEYTLPVVLHQSLIPGCHS